MDQANCTKNRDFEKRLKAKERCYHDVSSVFAVAAVGHRQRQVHRDVVRLGAVVARLCHLLLHVELEELRNVVEQGEENDWYNEGSA